MKLLPLILLLLLVSCAREPVCVKVSPNYPCVEMEGSSGEPFDVIYPIEW